MSAAAAARSTSLSSWSAAAGTAARDVSHHGVHIVEHVEARLGGALVCIGQRAPAVADADPLQMHAPKQRHRVDHLELDLRRSGANARVIDSERLVGLAQIQIVEGGVPPVVKREAVVILRPVRRRSIIQAIPWPAGLAFPSRA